MAELHPRPFIPFLVACAGIGTFSLMDAAMKDLALSLGAYNAVIWRNSLGALLMGVLFVATRQKWPEANLLKIHLWRSIVVSVMAVSFFWSLTKLPLAEAIGLSFIAPVIALYLAAAMLGETIGREAIWASLAGLGGVAIIMAGRLSGDYDEGHIWGAAAVLFSAVVFAYNLILARRQARADCSVLRWWTLARPGGVRLCHSDLSHSCGHLHHAGNRPYRPCPRQRGAVTALQRPAGMATARPSWCMRDRLARCSL